MSDLDAAGGYGVCSVIRSDGERCGCGGIGHVRHVPLMPQMCAMLRHLEWAAMDHRDMEPRCPECGARYRDGRHHDDCDLASLLGKLP